MRNPLAQIHWKCTNADYNDWPGPRPSQSNEIAHCPPGNGNGIGTALAAPDDGNGDAAVLAAFGHACADDGDDDDAPPVAPPPDWARHASENWHAMWHASPCPPNAPALVPARDA